MTKPKVNLLDLAASAISSAVVAADQITSLCKPGMEDSKNVRLKIDGSFVTDADLAAQRIIVQCLQTVSKDIRLVGEESEEDMATSAITGHEEQNERIFRLAQQEVQMRYNRTNGKWPLASESTDNVNEVDSASQTEDDPADLSRLEEYIVNPDRVSVFIDPLDGTKAYARGDYAPVSILIAIILDESPCFGVICKPFGYEGHASILDSGCVGIYGGTLLGAAYTAGGQRCSWENENGQLPRAVISSSRSEGIVQEFVTHLGSRGMIDPQPMMISGAGEKSLRIILRNQQEGLWFFPKAGTSLWDVAASDALLRATGGRLTDKDGNSMDYSKSRTEAENENGVVACFDAKLHSECIKLFLEGTWNEEST